MTILCAPMISAVLFEGIVGGVFLVSGYYFAPKIYCHFTECCAECCKNKWIKLNMTVYSQPFEGVFLVNT